MNKNDNYEIVLRNVMLFVNFIAVWIICTFIVFTTDKLIYNYNARSFLNSVDALPMNPYNLFFRCVAMMGVLGMTFFLRNFKSFAQKKYIIWILILDIVVSVYTIFLLNFNYNGLIFYVFAETIYYVKENKYHIIFMGVAVIGYLVMDFEMLSIYMPLFDLADYIQCYPATVQQYIFGIYNIMRSLNIVLFIIFCVYIMRIQRGTIEDVNQLYKELQSKNNQLKIYSDMAEKMAQTKERNRLAREIHDTLGHTLTGITTGLDACITLVDISPTETKKQLQLLAKVSREGVKDIRRSVNELRPDSLERLSLEMAIREMINDMSQVSNVEIFFDSNNINLKFDDDEENTLYRVIQESITNAVRHGKAKKIWITISRENAFIYLMIKDNGCGCTDMKSGFGTRHIRERVEMLNGTVDFEGQNGFTVKACIPIRWGEEYD